MEKEEEVECGHYRGHDLTFILHLSQFLGHGHGREKNLRRLHWGVN